jgi:molybdopterin/thiamine biosynthesis adenylyltransferase
VSEHRPLSDRTALVAGLGNIGSHLPALLLRAGVGALRLVDRDVVEAKNLAAQDYLPGHVGRPKAEVQAARLREQFPGRRVEGVVCDLEDLPAGCAAVDLILAGLDSRRARQVLAGDLAWPLGVPVVDGGVGDGGLGRVQVFVPGPATACLECTWGAADYRLAAAEYPCVMGATAAGAPTGAPAYLGAFVAALMAAEAVRLLGGPPAEESYEVPFDLKAWHMRRFALRRAAGCRHDHEVVREVLPAGRTAAELLAAIEGRFGRADVRLEGRRGLGRLTAGGLRQDGPAALAGRGFVAGDRLRARGPGGSVWLEVTP